MTKMDRSHDEYLRGIEEYMAQIRLSPMLLSPKEWTVAEKWQADQIPLMVVFRGIDGAIRSVLTHKSDYSKLRITLSYCDKPVRAAFKSYLKAQSLFSDEKRRLPETDLCAMPEDADAYYVLNRLEALALELDELAADPTFEPKHDDIEHLAENLRVLLIKTKKSRRGAWLERVQTQLVKLDKEFLQIAKDCISPDRLEQLLARARDEAKVARAAGDRALLNYLMDKAVREELDLFVIGLFDL